MTEQRDDARPAHRPLASFATVAAPAGFGEVELFDPFEAHVGPFFERVEADDRHVSAFIVDARHVRADGTVHEGMMLAFADAFMGGAAWRGSGGRSCVTLSMQTSHLADARLGDLVLCRTKLEHRTRAIVFVSASFSVGADCVMTATSLWKVLGER